MKTFSQCVNDALATALKSDEGPGAIPQLLAVALRDELHREGYAVHRVADCVRPGPPPLGRSLSEALAEAKGGTE